MGCNGLDAVVDRTALPRPGQPRRGDGRPLPRPSADGAGARAARVRPVRAPFRGDPLPAAGAVPVLGRGVGHVARRAARGRRRRGDRRGRPLARRVRGARRRRRPRVRRRREARRRARRRHGAGGRAALRRHDRFPRRRIPRRARARRPPRPRDRQRQRAGAARAVWRRRRARGRRGGRPRRDRRARPAPRRHRRVPLAAHGAGRRPPARGARAHAGPPDADPGLLERHRRALRRRAQRAGREPPAPRALARDAARAARRGRRALRRARPRRRAHGPREADAGGGMTAATANEQRAHPADSAQAATTPHRPAERRRGMTAGIFGVGAALPERLITNQDIVDRLDTSDEWIVRRTGIRERRVLAADQPLSELATRACALALEDAGRTPDEVDQIIVSTITPDRVTPGVAPYVALALGAERASAVDVNAACAGFIYALDQAAAQIESGRARVVLVCGAEALSRITDHDDRGTAMLFGDGAGAVVVAGGELEIGCGGFVLGTDASQADMLYAERDDPKLRMEGREVYRHAIRRMVEATGEAIRRAGLTIDDVDLFVAHQANVRILTAAGNELGLPPEKVMVNIDRVANTSSASIPLALADAERDGRLKPGAIVALSAFGAGFVWGSGVVSWKERTHVCA